MSGSVQCAREGCNRWHVHNDPYCSARCARIEHGLEDPPEGTPEDRAREARNRRRRIATLRKKHGSTVAVTNPDAMAHVVNPAKPAQSHAQGRKMTGDK